jgi:hypothetical protein
MEVLIYLGVTLLYLAALAYGVYKGWRERRPVLLWSCVALLAFSLGSYVLPFLMT